MDLYILRHAWAEEQDASRWPDDSLRPLTSEGRKRFAKLIAQLAKTQFQPSLIVSSPYLRCRQTAQVIVHALQKREVIVVEREELAPGGSLEKLLAWTGSEARSHQAIAWVGHAPEVEVFSAALIGQGHSSLRFAKGAVALIRFDGPPKLGQGELQWLLTAKVLGL